MARYQLAGRWLTVAMRPEIVKRSLRISLLVGMLLAIINHGDRLLSGEVDGVALLRIGLTFLVPYGVSTWASVQTVLREE